MQVLKHDKTGRLFMATPALLKNKNLSPALPHEAESYIASLDESNKEKMEKQGVKVIVPEDFDLDTDISLLGKVELTAIARKLGVSPPSTMKVKDLLPFVSNLLQQARDERDARIDLDEGNGTTLEPAPASGNLPPASNLVQDSVDGPDASGQANTAISLAEQAKALGIKVDGRWSEDRISQEINAFLEESNKAAE